MPQRAASPERGCTKAAYPSGSASASPVGSTARSPGASSAATVVTTSAPASPGSAYAGSGTSGSRRCTRTSTGGGVDRARVHPAERVTGPAPGAGAGGRLAVELGRRGDELHLDRRDGQHLG